MAIDKRAVVSGKAKIHETVEVGPYAIIEEGAQIGPNVKIWPHAYICGEATIGEATEIHMGAVIGHRPQDLAYKGGRTRVRIGRRNIIREYVTIHRGTADNSETVIGDDCYLMALCHVGHNCELGSKVVLANCALLAGYVSVGDMAFVSGNVVVHQFCRIGALAMIGGFTGINKDVPPYMLVRGPSVVRSVNLVGLRRAKLPRETIESIRQAYELLYMSDLNTAQAIERMRALPKSKELDYLIEFILSSKRGICKYKYSDTDYFE